MSGHVFSAPVKGKAGSAQLLLGGGVVRVSCVVIDLSTSCFGNEHSIYDSSSLYMVAFATVQHVALLRLPSTARVIYQRRGVILCLCFIPPTVLILFGFQGFVRDGGQGELD